MIVIIDLKAGTKHFIIKTIFYKIAPFLSLVQQVICVFIALRRFVLRLLHLLLLLSDSVLLLLLFALLLKHSLLLHIALHLIIQVAFLTLFSAHLKLTCSLHPWPVFKGCVRLFDQLDVGVPLHLARRSWGHVMSKSSRGRTRPSTKKMIGCLP
jgi:hypothetical protein